MNPNSSGSGSSAVLLFSAMLLPIVALAFFMVSTSEMHHWFVIPVLFSGMLLSYDVLKWVSGRYDWFDPLGVISAISLHFFFFAPLLHVYWDFWIPNVQEPADWRDWLGGMACLNLLGVLLFRKIAQGKIREVSVRQFWVIRNGLFFPAVLLLMLLTFVAQIMVFQQFGGLKAYMYASTDDTQFEGLGIIFMFSESFPILSFIAFIALCLYKKWRPGWIALFLVLGIFLVEKIIFGGLRGSRSNTIWGLFWAVGLVHFFIRPLNGKIISLGLGLMFLFMMGYSLYKTYGPDALAIAQSKNFSMSESKRYDGRTVEGIFLADFARTDVQSYLLYRMVEKGEFDYGLGRTYAAAVTLLVPKSIWPNKPPSKKLEGTNALYGNNAYMPGVFESTRIYGLAGEGMLNFGPLFVPFCYVVFGFLVKASRRYMSGLMAGDARILYVPFIVNFLFMFLTVDSDNLVFFLFKNGFLPILLVVFCTRKLRVGPNSPVGALT